MTAPEVLAEERLRVEAAQRDHTRFGELYEENFERVYAYVVRRVRSREEAEDVTAEVFRRALANLGRFEWRGVPFAAWLFRIAAHAIADRAKRTTREHGEPLPRSEPERTAEWVEERAALYRAVRELPSDSSREIAGG